MMVAVSGAALGTILTTPLSSLPLLSFDETAHWASAPGGSASPNRSSSRSEVRSTRRRVMGPSAKLLAGPSSTREDHTTAAAAPLARRRARAQAHHPAHLGRARQPVVHVRETAQVIEARGGLVGTPAGLLA